MTNNTVSLHENINSSNQAFGFIECFFRNIGLSSILRSLGFFRQTGIPVLRVFQTIFTLIFNHKNWWRTCKDSNDADIMKKDVVYRFLNHEYYKWEEFLINYPHQRWGFEARLKGSLLPKQIKLICISFF